METGFGRSPLFLDGWLELNRWRSGLQPRRLRVSPKDSPRPAFEAVIYLNRAGKIVQPHGNPYLPIDFSPTETEFVHRRRVQWLDASRLPVEEMRRRGLRSQVAFTPNVTDVRPWQWAGFRAEVSYTFVLSFPFELAHADSSVRKSVAKAHRAGYQCCRTERMAEVLACLQETERRKAFSHRLSLPDLEMAQKLLQREHLMAHVCYAPDGEPASAVLVLYQAGSHALGLAAGTGTRHLQSGAYQLLLKHVLDDLQANGATAFDFCGANIPRVAASKSFWGATLVPYYRVLACNVRNMILWARDCLQSMRSSNRP